MTDKLEILKIVNRRFASICWCEECIELALTQIALICDENWTKRTRWKGGSDPHRDPADKLVDFQGT
jgi:hypothetical protein